MNWALGEDWYPAKTSLKTKLVLFFLLLDISTLALMSLSVAYDATEAMEQQIQQRLEDKAHHTSQAIAEDLRTKWAYLRSTAQNPLVVMGLVDSLGRDAYLMPLIDKLSLPGRGSEPPYLALLDYRGRLITANHPDGSDLRDAPWVAAVLRGEEHAAVFRDPEGRYRLRFALPIYHQGQVEGILVSHFPLSLLAELLPNEAALNAILVDANGQSLYGTLPFPVAQSAMQQVEPQRVHFVEYRDHLYSLIELPTLADAPSIHWQLVLSMPSEAVSAPVSQLLWRMMAVAAASALAVTILVFLRAGRFVRPLTRLQQTMNTIMTEGNLSQSVRINTNDEVGALGESFNRMMAALKTQKDALRAEVEERRRAESELLEANGALRNTLEELKTAQAQLVQSEKMASLGQLAAGVAHEINNPVGFVKSNLNTLCHYERDLMALIDRYDCALQEPRPGPAREALVQFRQEIDLDFLREDMEALLEETREGLARIAKIVADLKEFSHVNHPEIEEIDLNVTLDKVVNVAWNELKYRAQIVRDYGALPPLRCYAGQIGQVFLNLLVNAAQAMTDRGEIRLKTEVQGRELVASVADTGSGIAPEIVDKVFDPFFTTKPVGKGTGLGLHLAYKTVQAHGGRIEVDSTPGSGTTFRIRLPLAGPPDSDPQQGSASLAKSA